MPKERFMLAAFGYVFFIRLTFSASAGQETLFVILKDFILAVCFCKLFANHHFQGIWNKVNFWIFFIFNFYLKLPLAVTFKLYKNTIILHYWSALVSFMKRSFLLVVTYNCISPLVYERFFACWWHDLSAKLIM